MNMEAWPTISLVDFIMLNSTQSLVFYHNTTSTSFKARPSLCFNI